MIVLVLFFMKIGFKNVDFQWAGFQNPGVLPEHRKMVASAQKVGDRDDAIDVLGLNLLPCSFFRAYLSGQDALTYGGGRIQSIAKPRGLQESRADYVGFRDAVFECLPKHRARDVGQLNTVSERMNIEKIGVGDGTDRHGGSNGTAVQDCCYRTSWTAPGEKRVGGCHSREAVAFSTRIESVGKRRRVDAYETLLIGANGFKRSFNEFMHRFVSTKTWYEFFEVALKLHDATRIVKRNREPSEIAR